MKRLLLAAALAPLSFAAAHAGTISGSDTGTHQTSTEGDIIINSGASVTPPTSSTSGTVAITINSNNSVTDNGAITVTETTTGGGTNQGIPNGPFANGADRFGIQVAGAGPFTGNISVGSAGSITVIGENSAGISVNTGLNGFIDDLGTISITGGNANTTDVSYGVFQAAGALITGNVTVANVNALGANATGVALNGGVGGAVDIVGAISATGFRTTAVPVDPAVLANLTADQLAHGGPALSIGGNVAAGVTIAAPTAAVGNVAATTGGSLQVFGPAPALLIGGASPITIGAATNGYSLTIGGGVQGNGDYPDTSAVGVQIGGLNGLAVTSGGVAAGGAFAPVLLPGGIDVTGTLSAITIAHTAGQGTAIALDIGPGVVVPRINNTGTVIAAQQNNLGPGNLSPGPVAAILIEPGVVAGNTTLTNTGAITALITGIVGVPGLTITAGGILGQASAIFDESGALKSVVNMGNITARLTPAVSGQLAEGRAIAIFENNANPFTYIQCWAVDAGGNCTTTGNATLSPSTRGDLIFAGTGSDTIDIWGGNLTGSIFFGNSTANVLDIENGGVVKGGLAEAPGGQVAINVNDGQLFQTVPGNIAVSTLHVGSTGALIFAGDPAHPDASIFNVAGNATLDTGAHVGLTLVAPLTGATSFTVIQAGNLSAGNISSELLGQIPFLETASITTTATTLTINAAPKTTQELGLNPAETSMFAAWNAAFPSDAQVAADVLSKTDRPSFIHLYDQFLPDYAGGPFELLLEGQREIARTESETPVKLPTDSTRGWVQEIGYLAHQDTTSQVNGYQGVGFGFAAGIEHVHGKNAIGLAGSFVTTGTQDKTQPTDQSLSASAFEIGAYWRYGEGAQGPQAAVTVNGGVVTLGSRRFLNDVNQTSTPPQIVSREAKASWLAGIVAVEAVVGYQFESGRFYVRPQGSIDYVALFESAYTEHGGHEPGGTGDAFDLSVRSRTSAQADAEADLVLGMTFGQTVIWRPELTFGYRAVLGGGPASTTANFVNGQAFTIDPQFDNKGAFVGRLGVRASGLYADFSADAGGQFATSYQVYQARAAARFLF